MIMNAHDARLKTEAAIKDRELLQDQHANVLYNAILEAVEAVADIGGDSVHILWPAKADIRGALHGVNPITYEGKPALSVGDRLGFFVRCVPDVREHLIQAGFTVGMGRNEDANPTIHKVSW